MTDYVYIGKIKVSQDLIFYIICEWINLENQKLPNFKNRA